MRKTINNCFYIHTLGCKVNWCDSEKIVEEANKIGWVRLSDQHSADFYIVNTCTVTSQADATARKVIRKLKKENPKAPIFVTGCYARTSNSALKKIPEISLIIESNKPEIIVNKIKNYLNENFNEIINEYNPVNSEFNDNRTRAFIKIQDGCDRFCAYCKIPFARGRAASVPEKKIINEIKNLADNNYKEIVLTGINIAAYNYNSILLIDLLKKISDLNIIPRVRLSSVEATAITEDLCKIFAESESLMPQIHIPLQSGSDRILKLMNRKIMSGDVLVAADKFLSTVKNAVITTDIIVGLPGEEKEDFEQTLKIVEKIPFGKVHIFQYSPREGTAAAKLKNLFVQPSEIKRRAKILEKAAEKSAENCREKFKNKTLNVLLEQKTENGWTGFSENYLRVCSSLPNLKQNKIVKINMNNSKNKFVKF